jgi:hypothetical protein
MQFNKTAQGIAAGSSSTSLRIECPKKVGRLQDELGLANDNNLYRMLIVSFFFFAKYTVTDSCLLL